MARALIYFQCFFVLLCGCNEPEQAELRTLLEVSPAKKTGSNIEVKSKPGICLRGADQVSYDDPNFATSEIVGRLDVTENEQTIICGATLVHPSFVLTSMSCIRKLNAAGDGYVYFPKEAMTFRPFYRWSDRKIVEVIQYDAAPLRNVALLKLEKQLDPTSVRIPYFKRGGFDLAAGEPVLAVGFGGWVKDAADPQWDIGKKRAGYLTYIGRENRTFDLEGYSAAAFGPGPQGAMTCEGDGGSPVFVERGGVHFLAGIFANVESTDYSTQESKCITADKALYVTIDDVLGWVDQKIAAADPTHQAAQQIFVKGTVSAVSATSITLTGVSVLDATVNLGITGADSEVTFAVGPDAKIFGDVANQVKVTLRGFALEQTLQLAALIVDGYSPPDEEVINPCDGSIIKVPSTEDPRL